MNLLAPLLDDLAAELAGVERVAGPAAVEYRRAGRAFAVAGAERVEFRVLPAVTRAALSTPDTAASPRGGDWVAFAPAELDQFVLDRASAWFELAWRRAGPSSA